MKFIMETITGRKGIKSFKSLNEYIDYMTKYGDKIKTIVEADLPYDDKPVSVATPSQSNGWEQVNKATFGDVIKKAEKGDCVLPHKASSVFKDEAKFEPSKSSEKADTSSEPKIDSTPVKNNNEGTEKDLPKFEYKDDSESSSEKSEPKEEKKDSEEKDDKKKEIKESLEEDDINPQVLQELYEIICDQMGDDYLSDYDEVDYMELLDCVKDFGNDIDGFNSELAREYADALKEKWVSEHSNNLNEGFKDKFKKAVATGAMAASLAAAGNAHGMDKDPYYDGATRPFDSEYSQQEDFEQPKIAKVTKDGMIIDTNGDEWTKKQWEALMNGEDPYADGATKPFEESFDAEIAETLRIAGVQLNEAEDEVEETPNHDEDGEIDEKSGKEKLFEEDPEGSKKKSLEDAKKALQAARDNYLVVSNGDDFASSNGRLSSAEKALRDAEQAVKDLGGNPYEEESSIEPNPDDFKYKVGQKFQNMYHPEYKIEITGYKAGIKGADNIYTCKDIGKPSGREDINDATIKGSWIEI